MSFKSVIKNLGLSFVKQIFGVNLVDQRTGMKIGNVAVIRWKGRLMMIGFDGATVYPHFLPQKRETYWGQELGFSSHPPPDFLHVEKSNYSDFPSKPGRSDFHGENVAKSES